MWKIINWNQWITLQNESDLVVKDNEMEIETENNEQISKELNDKLKETNENKNGIEMESNNETRKE